MRVPQLGRPGPKTSTERSRLFRERHPDYYRRLRAQKNAEYLARVALQAQAKVEVKVPLALPAPVVQLPTIFDLIREQQKRADKIEVMSSE